MREKYPTTVTATEADARKAQIAEAIAFAEGGGNPNRMNRQSNLASRGYSRTRGTGYAQAKSPICGRVTYGTARSTSDIPNSQPPDVVARARHHSLHTLHHTQPLQHTTPPLQPPPSATLSAARHPLHGDERSRCLLPPRDLLLTPPRVFLLRPLWRRARRKLVDRLIQREILLKRRRWRELLSAHAVAGAVAGVAGHATQRSAVGGRSAGGRAGR